MSCSLNWLNISGAKHRATYWIPLEMFILCITCHWLFALTENKYPVIDILVGSYRVSLFVFDWFLWGGRLEVKGGGGRNKYHRAQTMTLADYHKKASRRKWPVLKKREPITLPTPTSLLFWAGTVLKVFLMPFWWTVKTPKGCLKRKQAALFIANQQLVGDVGKTFTWTSYKPEVTKIISCSIISIDPAFQLMFLMLKRTVWKIHWILSSTNNQCYYKL